MAPSTRVLLPSQSVQFMRLQVHLGLSAQETPLLQPNWMLAHHPPGKEVFVVQTSTCLTQADSFHEDLLLVRSCKAQERGWFDFCQNPVFTSAMQHAIQSSQE